MFESHKTRTHEILKIEDINKFLTEDEKSILATLALKVVRGRKYEGRQPSPAYYVCNTDEPYASKVLEVILEGERDKNE